MSLHGEVIEWRMTEEERLAYIQKYPIKKQKKKKGTSYALIHHSDFGKSTRPSERPKQG